MEVVKKALEVMEVSILCLRCTALEERVEGYGITLVSILCLRCAETRHSWLKHILTMVSILCLRCLGAGQSYAQYATDRFNSLFEMQIKPGRCARLRWDVFQFSV